MNAEELKKLLNHVKENKIDIDTALDQLREQQGSPMIITSGYRCPAYNTMISSTGFDGPHTSPRS